MLIYVYIFSHRYIIIFRFICVDIVLTSDLHTRYLYIETGFFFQTSMHLHTCRIRCIQVYLYIYIFFFYVVYTYIYIYRLVFIYVYVVVRIRVSRDICCV